MATIDVSPASIPPTSLLNVRRPAVILHCPVSLLKNFPDYAGEYVVHCNMKENVTIQTVSSHHIYYDADSLMRGSSDGAVHWADSNLLFGMHCEDVNDSDYFMNEDVEGRVIAVSDKQVCSDDYPVEQPAKRLKSCDSETIRSLSGGNEGHGHAIIISRLKRLMNYITGKESNF